MIITFDAGRSVLLFSSQSAQHPGAVSLRGLEVNALLFPVMANFFELPHGLLAHLFTCDEFNGPTYESRAIREERVTDSDSFPVDTVFASVSVFRWETVPRDPQPLQSALYIALVCFSCCSVPPALLLRSGRYYKG